MSAQGVHFKNRSLGSDYSLFKRHMEEFCFVFVFVSICCFVGDLVKQDQKIL